jgi:tetratricopeptide (TPR) repeat protein
LVVALLACGSAAAAEARGTLADENVIGDLVRAGRQLFQERKLDAALAKFQEIIKLDANNKVANHHLARINALLGRYKAAIDLVRKLQSLGESIRAPKGRNEDMMTTLDIVINGILATQDLKQRADLLIHFRETIRGLTLPIEQRIDAHLMGIYAKMGETHLHDIVKARYFTKPVTGEACFLAARAYLDYDVNLALAATYLEQAADEIRAREVPSTGNPEDDALYLRRRDADATVIEDFLAYTYSLAKVLDPQKNRFMAAEANPKATFANVTEAAGLKGFPAQRVAIGDFDNDGLEDLCITGGLEEDSSHRPIVAGHIFKNNNGKTFTEVTKALRIDLQNALAALWLDYDNDGRLDLLVASFPRIRLWRNLADGAFKDVTEEAGLGYAFPGPPEAISATDYDGDGHLDLFIGCFEHPQEPSAGQPSFLFHNTGKGWFDDVSTAAGIGATKFCTRGCAWGDFNNDGRPDLYVANFRLHPNQLWANRGDGTFGDEAKALGVQGISGQGQLAGQFGHSIGCAWGDVDNDGNLDLIVANLCQTKFMHFSDPTALYRNGGKKEAWRFEDILPASGIRFEEMTTEASFCDFDNDGDLDLLLTSIYKERPTFLYQNVGGGKFQPATWRAGAIAFNTWGQAWFDKDNDGDMDLLLAGANGVILLENQARDTSWLRVQLAGKRSNRLGIGARVTVVAGALTLIREVTAGSGSTSQSSPVAHFGLGSHKGNVDIAVRWPNGKEQRVAGSAINRLVKIEEQ